jgi:hypothetical protein
LSINLHLVHRLVKDSPDQDTTETIRSWKEVRHIQEGDVPTDELPELACQCVEFLWGQDDDN